MPDGSSTTEYFGLAIGTFVDDFGVAHDGVSAIFNFQTYPQANGGSIPATGSPDRWNSLQSNFSFQGTMKKKHFYCCLSRPRRIFAFGQAEVSGKSITTGPQLWEFFAGGSGGPLIYLARTDGAVFGTGVTGELLPAACSGVMACLANAYNASATTGHQGAALSYTGSPAQVPPLPEAALRSRTNINRIERILDWHRNVRNGS